MQIGLKLWSTNTDFYLEEAKRLYNLGFYNYIELYVVPGTITTIKEWKKLHIPFTLHAPHFAHNVNLADKAKFNYNKKCYDEVILFKNELNADYIIVHSGMNGTIEEVIYQLDRLKLSNILIENKPFVPPFCQQNICRGSTIEEISEILNKIDCLFCLDISHAICTANYLKQEPYNYLIEFEKLSPIMYHLSDGEINSHLDKHLHFTQGTYDIKKIFSIINTSKKISIETNKTSKENLNDFIDDIIFLKSV